MEYFDTCSYVCHTPTYITFQYLLHYLLTTNWKLLTFVPLFLFVSVFLVLHFEKKLKPFSLYQFSPLVESFEHRIFLPLNSEKSNIWRWWTLSTSFSPLGLGQSIYLKRLPILLYTEVWIFQWGFAATLYEPFILMMMLFMAVLRCEDVMAVTMLQLHQGIRLICSNLLQSLSLYSAIQPVKRIFLRTSFEIQIKHLPSTKYLEREMNYFSYFSLCNLIGKLLL